MKKQILIAAALAFIFAVVAAKTTFAECSGQYGQYGGCPSSDSIMIDKTVGKANTNVEYVDNLSSSDTKFKAGQTVHFQLKVKNTSSNTIGNVRVEDHVPMYLDPVEGPGNYDAATRRIVFYIPELKANEEKVYTLKMQVWPQTSLNAPEYTNICASNRADVAGGTANDSDSAQFCVEKTTTAPVAVTQVPATGAEDWILTLTASIAALGAGIMLKKKYN